MGLLSKLWPGRKPAHIIEFNSDQLSQELVRNAAKMVDIHNTEGYRVLRDFMERTVSANVLGLACCRELTSEQFAFRRGRIDGMRDFLAQVDQAIANSKKAKETKDKSDSADSSIKRNYLRRERRMRAVGGPGRDGILD